MIQSRGNAIQFTYILFEGYSFDLKLSPLRMVIYL